MKQLTQTLVLALALTISATALAQAPASATRQRKAITDGAPPAATADKPAAGSVASDDRDADKKPDSKKGKTKPPAEVTADAQTNRADQSSEEAAIVPYYNNFFTTYRLGPEDVVSV